MNLYNAIMKAAEHIERNPESYRFFSHRVPECGMPGCLWGHIGAQLGMVGACNMEVAVKMAKDSTGHLYSFMDLRWNRMPSDSPERTKLLAWHHNAKVAAEGLREYAEKYHGHEKLHPGFVKLRGDLNELEADVMLEQAP
jgi:hypothetical protein